MRVLHIIPSIASVRGGTSRAILDMVKALRIANINAEILTTNDNGPQVLDVVLEQWTEYEHIPILFSPRFSPSFAPLREFAFSRHLTAWLWQHISEYDLVHVHALFSYASTLAMLFARIRRVPYVVTPHGLLCTWSLQQKTRKKEIYLNLIERSNLNHAQALHFTAEQEQQEVLQLGLTMPVSVIPLGLEMPVRIPDARSRLRQLLNIPKDEPVILFLSRLHPKKGLDYLIPALGKVAVQRFSFVIAGSGDPAYEREVEMLLKSSGMDIRTQNLGFVQGETKDLLLQGADLLALTSYSENFGIAVLEALAAGTPVLITPGVALAPIVKQHQLGYVTELDETSIINTLEYFFTHLEEARLIGERARKFISEHYGWDRIGSSLVQLYKSSYE